ncbi:MAG: hypothetical protein JXR84_11690 [Anaerolineae bacterium]|nr:hypothetical protein [Anaerolineae bacterium]
MKHKVLWLRVTFWWGIIADVFEAIRMTFPRLFLATTGSTLTPSAGFRFGLLYGAPVMLGWTLLLLWADRKPLERKGILLCLIPVVVAYIIVGVVGISIGAVPLAITIPTSILQVALIALCLFSYLGARTTEQN